MAGAYGATFAVRNYGASAMGQDSSAEAVCPIVQALRRAAHANKLGRSWVTGKATRWSDATTKGFW